MARRPSPAARAQPDLFGDAGVPASGGIGSVERWAAGRGLTRMVGLDEAGRGPLAGPVVCAAVALPAVLPDALADLHDSKKLTERQRDRLAPAVREHALAWAVAVVGPDEIDALNILRASLEGMRRAWADVVAALPEWRDAVVWVDGKDRAPLPADVDQRPLIKGDARSFHVAAASVLAKTVRDAAMVAADATWPQYGFAKHKGYPTAAHRQAIAEHGPCPIHRRSFRMPERAGGPAGVNR